MRLLLDANLSPRLRERLRETGYDVAHVKDLGLLSASDEAIFDVASRDGWTIITADTDFSMLLALRRSARPSVLLLRDVADLRWTAHADLILANIDALAVEFERGAVASLSPTRLAIRSLPLTPPVGDTTAPPD